MIQCVSSVIMITVKPLLTRKVKHVLCILVSIIVLYFFGAFHHIFETDFNTDFHYPYDGDIEVFVEQLRNNFTPDIEPINVYNFKFHNNPYRKCADVEELRLVLIIKSAPDNFHLRSAIRITWGYEKRFSDVEVRTVFLIGKTSSEVIQKSIDEEYRHYSDIVQANFTDSYYNNTYKTMMGFQWANKYCTNSKYYMFVDDDYYVSIKNVHRFIHYPTNYPEYLRKPFSNVKMLINSSGRKTFQVDDYHLTNDARLYAGYLFKSAPHRHLISKWYVSLEEYPYHLWPPYVTAGAYILSRNALIDMYYTSYYTKHFKFDDIYLGLLAYKAKIEPYHCDEFYFYKKPYNKFNYEYTVASHGYSDPEELIHNWNEQKSLKNA